MRKPPPFFTIFIFSSDVYNKFYKGLARQHYPEDIRHDDDQLSTKSTQQKRLEIMKMMVSEDITHDGDQLSTKTTQDHEHDGIMETKEDFEEKKRVYSRISCVIFYI